jgi:hypothetical protein
VFTLLLQAGAVGVAANLQNPDDTLRHATGRTNENPFMQMAGKKYATYTKE